LVSVTLSGFFLPSRLRLGSIGVKKVKLYGIGEGTRKATSPVSFADAVGRSMAISWSLAFACGRCVS
jgi:hypothetical protein